VWRGCVGHQSGEGRGANRARRWGGGRPGVATEGSKRGSKKTPSSVIGFGGLIMIVSLVTNRKKKQTTIILSGQNPPGSGPALPGRGGPSRQAARTGRRTPQPAAGRAGGPPPRRAAAPPASPRSPRPRGRTPRQKPQNRLLFKTWGEGVRLGPTQGGSGVPHPPGWGGSRRTQKNHPKRGVKN